MQKTKHYAVFLGVAFATGVITQILIPWPFGLFTAMLTFIVFPIVYRKMILKDWPFVTKDKISKYCIICQKKTSDSTCPRCGSRQFRMY